MSAPYIFTELKNEIRLNFSSNKSINNDSSEEGAELPTNKEDIKQKKRRGPKAKSGEGAGSRIASLISESFFDKPKTPSDIQKELATLAHTYALNQITAALTTLIKNKTLRRIGNKGTYQYVKK
jgi:hypothetical protein